MATPFEHETTGEDHTQTRLAFPPTALAAPPLPPSRYAAGSVLCAKYRLESLIGEGGMGAVWRASNLRLDLPVAIKLIRSDLDRNALCARLELEARSVAKLGHPAIVRIYDVDETERGDPFIVMELLEGDTLAQLLALGRLSAARAVQLLLPIIDACVVAHAHGIVHRDLKPDNLLIAVDGQRIQPKILDFGIAKLSNPHEINQRLTAVGTLLGSPDYMSPEQARGRDDVDYRTDIWSICVVLYEAITGTMPFSAANYNALLRAIVEDEPTPPTHCAAGNGELWRILKQGLAKERQDRPRSMAELGRSLAAWLVSHGIHEDACGRSVSRWLSRSSDPLNLGEASAEDASLVSDSFKRNPHRDSSPEGVDSRGPFTATIRPEPGRRTRRVAALACALLGTAALAIGLHGHPPASTASREPAPLSHAESALASPRVSTAPPPSASEGPRPDASAASTVTPAPSVMRSIGPQSPRSGRPSPSSLPRAQAKPAFKASGRELDLISPY